MKMLIPCFLLPGYLMQLLLLMAVGGIAAVQAETVQPGKTETIRGVLRAEREAVLASTLSERIIAMPYQEGDSFPTGATLVEFDCSRLKAELKAVQAEAAAQSREADVQRELLTMDATGRAEADIAVFRENQGRARVQVVQRQMVGCEVLAPFAGQVVEPLMRENETPAANERLIHIVSDGPLELHMVVPSCWLSWLKQGSTFEFQVDETGDTLEAEVDRVAAAVDPVSQTVKVISKVNDVPESVLPGMSGTAGWARTAEDLEPTAACRAGRS